MRGFLGLLVAGVLGAFRDVGHGDFDGVVGLALGGEDGVDVLDVGVGGVEEGSLLLGEALVVVAVELDVDGVDVLLLGQEIEVNGAVLADEHHAPHLPVAEERVDDADAAVGVDVLGHLEVGDGVVGAASGVGDGRLVGMGEARLDGDGAVVVLDASLGVVGGVLVEDVVVDPAVERVAEAVASDESATGGDHGEDDNQCGFG